MAVFSLKCHQDSSPCLCRLQQSSELCLFIKDLTISVSFLLSTTPWYNGSALDTADHQAPEGIAVINISTHHGQNICFCH